MTYLSKRNPLLPNSEACMTAQDEAKKNQYVVRSKSALIYSLTHESVSRQYVEVNTQFFSRYAQQTYKRGYDVVSEALYRTFELMPLVSEQFADAIGSVMEHDLADLKSRLQKDLDDARNQSKKAGLNIRPSYTHVMEVAVKISTPQSMDYIEMIRQLDELSSLLDGLGLMRKIENRAKKDMLMTWQKELLHYSYKCRELCIETVRNIAEQQIKARKYSEARKKTRMKRLARQQKMQENFSEDSKEGSADTKDTKDTVVETPVSAESMDANLIDDC
jgi:hypothetical protein